jgi:uncharacterized protein DUF6484
MKVMSQIKREYQSVLEEATNAHPLDHHVDSEPMNANQAFLGPAVLIGELIAMKGGRTPLVLYPGQRGSAAIAALTAVDLRGDHVGKRVVLAFENADQRPIIIGVLREGDGWPLGHRLGPADVTADGERLIVSAREQLVLRCGHASITLTKEGKVIIEGTYVSSRATGVNRLRGASVQIN